jgi:hypothetical protein
MSYQNTGLRLVPAAIGTTVLAGLRRLGFWAAVLFPLTYLPVLYGVVGETSPVLVAAMCVLNVCCLWLGQGYEP